MLHYAKWFEGRRFGFRCLYGPILLFSLSCVVDTASAGVYQGLAALIREDYVAAMNALLPEATRGDIYSQVVVGDLYHQGKGVARDDEKAAYWYRKAADGGHADACSKLARMYIRGEGVPKDGQQAVDWYRKAADRGSYLADFALGALYYKGESITKNQREAYFWLLVYSRGKGDSTTSEWLRDLEKELSTQIQDEVRIAVEKWHPSTSPSKAEGSATLVNPLPRTPPLAPSREVVRSTGSGFFVAPERVVTNFHVAGDCERIRVAGRHEAILVGGDAQNDMALLAVPQTTYSHSVLRAGRVNLGESVTVVGFPLSGVLSGINVTAGNVSGLFGIGGDSRFLQITAPVQPGNSGGPLLDSGGRVVGVVVSKLDTLAIAKATGDVPQNVNFAISVNSLASFLNSQGVSFRSAVSGNALPPEEIARRGQSFAVAIDCWK
jgi:S1-C subfamily serine protease